MAIALDFSRIKAQWSPAIARAAIDAGVDDASGPDGTTPAIGKT
ncbi:MAG TPA: hypothetical protein VIJ17_14775 [Pseudolabrys sp.]|jgi:hypothetical protein